MTMIALLVIAGAIVTGGVGAQIPVRIQEELNRAACLVNCTSFEDESCNCGIADNKAKEWSVNPKNILEPPLLHCREDTMLTFTMHNPQLVYLIEYKSKFNETWVFFKISRYDLITVERLKADVEYTIRVWGVSKRGELFGPVETDWVKTLDRNYSPRIVPRLWLRNFSMINEDYTAIINWSPSEDLSCYYEFVWFGGEDISDYTQKEVRDPSTLYELKIGELLFDSNYSVAVMTKSSDWMRESEKTWLHFKTQPCLDIYASLNFCPPPSPTGLKIESYEVSNLINGKHKVHNIILTWNSPELQPDGYTAIFRSIMYKTNNSLSYRNASGTARKVIFENVDLGAHFQISLAAWSSGGLSAPAILYQDSYLEILEDNTWLVYFIGIGAFGLFVLLISITAFFWKRKVKMQQGSFIEEVELKSLYPDTLFTSDRKLRMEDFSDEWEINYCDLHLLSILGQGAFGIVKKAVLLKAGKKFEVAVKMLRDETVVEEVRQFKQEIEILKSVGKNPHIVSMIGCCTKGPVGPLLVVEYCSKGDLLTYLRNICENMQYGLTEELNQPLDLEAEEEGINFFNKSYHINMSGSNVEVLEVKDLLSIGRQVATGMEYLSSVRVVHRDLAARNVLVCSDNSVKVSDFGLSRDVYRDNVYCKLGAGKLPLRWMAIESLTHQRYTTKSDVWSFGILLWEIFTLGGNPYPNIADTHKLLESLKAGERMECPENCSQETYCLMLNCWKENPKDRPNFTEICLYLEALLENTADYLNVNFNETLVQDFKDRSGLFPSENHYVL